MSRVTFPCLSMKQGKFTLVCFVAKAKVIWSLVKINQRDPDKDEGYQRILSPSRVNSIARYINKGNSIPNSVLVSLDPSSKITPDGKLSIPKKEDAGWVIDGQHRLAGAKEANSEIELCVVAFIGLDTDEQIKQFVVINREAKGVPTSLYYDLLKHLPPDKTEAEVAQEKATDIGQSLKKDEDSPFFNKIVIASPRKGEISLNNFVRKVAPLLRDKTGKFHTYNRVEQAGIINNYYKAFLHVFPDHFRPSKPTLMKTLGFGALINALPTVFDLCLKHFSGFTVEDVVKVLKKVEHFDFSSWDTYGAGNQAEAQAGEDFRLDLLRAFETETEAGTLRL
jgi:DGQHR domain-containing protein